MWLRLLGLSLLTVCARSCRATALTGPRRSAWTQSPVGGLVGAEPLGQMPSGALRSHLGIVAASCPPLQGPSSEWGATHPASNPLAFLSSCTKAGRGGFPTSAAGQECMSVSTVFPSGSRSHSTSSGDLAGNQGEAGANAVGNVCLFSFPKVLSLLCHTL